jgi:integrase
MSCTINFYIDKKTTADLKSIFCYVRQKTKTVVLHTQKKINFEKWDATKQEAKRSYTGYSDFNRSLQNFKEKVLSIIDSVEATATDFDAIKSALTKEFRKEEQAKNQLNFFDVYAKFIELRKSELSEGTIKRHQVIKKHLETYAAKYKKVLTFNSFTLLELEELRSYYYSIDIANNTTAKYIKILKTFLHWSMKNKFHQNNEFASFVTRTNTVDVIALTEAELFAIYNKDFSAIPRLDKVRDLFCFGCFTGQRFSDLIGFRFSDIRNNGSWYLRTQKTQDIIEIPLNDYALAIIEKYKSAGCDSLPKISNQKANKYLQELAGLSEVDEEIKKTTYTGSKTTTTTLPKNKRLGMHSSRRTFVTLSLEKGMRPEIVMKITGHKDLKSFKRYISITNTITAIEMKQIWNNSELRIVS